jgi:uncharacterized protein YtpQ (UPF0354 family)
MSQPTREQFAQQVIEIVRAKFPLAQIARAEQNFAMRVNGHVAPLENLYRITRLRPQHVVEDVERWAVDILRVAEGMPSDEDDSPEELRKRILPMLLPETATDPDMAMIVTQPLVAGLRVGYAVDSERTISYVSQPALERWQLTLDEIHQIALDNLVARSDAINAHAAQDESGQIYLILFQTLDGYDASRLLLPTLNERLREHLGSPFAAGVPNRDILLCFRNDDETVEKLRDQIQKDYRRMPHQVTDKLLLITQDGIAPRD